MRSHRKPLIGNFPVRGFVVYGGWRLRDWEIGRHQRLFSPSFLWKEVPRRDGGWSRETVLPHSGKPTPPRFARLPLPEEGARMIFTETLIQSFSFAVTNSRFPHICRAAPLSSFVFHDACALSAPAGHLPLEGKAIHDKRRSRHRNLLNPEP